MTTKPFTSAHVTLIDGEQGSGKSTTGTARLITDGISHITGIVNPQTGEYYQAEPLSGDEKKRIKLLGYALTHDTVKIIKPDNSKTITKIPAGFAIKTSRKIWCNYHLFGIEYNYIASWAELIRGLADYTFFDGRLIIDEYNLGAAARDSMTAIGRAISKENFLLRRKRLDVDIMISHQKLGEWTTRLVVNQWITCSYDERTGIITLTIKKKGEPTKEFSYDGRLYRKYYDTEERFKAPASQVAKAIAQGV